MLSIGVQATPDMIARPCIRIQSITRVYLTIFLRVYNRLRLLRIRDRCWCWSDFFSYRLMLGTHRLNIHKNIGDTEGKFIALYDSRHHRLPGIQQIRFLITKMDQKIVIFAFSHLYR